MNLNFDRYKSQQRCEAFLDCTGYLDRWYSKKREFEEFSLSYSNAIVYSNDLRFDAIELYKKGLHSLLFALQKIESKTIHCSWLSIVLYYSVFYFLRSSLAADGIGLIRNGPLFVLKDNPNSIPQKKGSKKYNTTHGGVINYYIDNFKLTDKLLTNEIDGLESYEWFKEVREILNYRQSNFIEPEILLPWEYAIDQKDQKRLSELIDLYYTDPDFVYCFLEDHAIVALPIKRAKLSLQILKSNNINIQYSAEELDYYKNLTEIEGNRNNNLINLIR